MPDAQGRTILGDLAGPYLVELMCWGCRRSVYMDPLTLMVAQGEYRLWAEVRGRFRCNPCGTEWPSGLNVNLVMAAEHPRVNLWKPPARSHIEPPDFTKYFRPEPKRGRR